MYFFVNVDNITSFLDNFGIDFTSFTGYEQSIVILLSNILFIISLIFLVNFIYKLLCRVLRVFF